jgi:serine/threonine protein kinase
VLRQAHIQATAILAEARTEAELIIASAKLQRARILEPPLLHPPLLHPPLLQPPLLQPPWPAANPSTYPALAEGHGPGRRGAAPIMVLNDRWRIHAPLSADSSDMAAMYEAYELADPTTIVVAKVFHQAHSDPQRFRAFLREVRGTRLRHPNIGQIIDSGQDLKSQALYLISPLYQPGSLNLHMRESPPACLPLSWKLWVVDQVLAGLQAAAMSNIIHLDIKPQNIVLDGPDNVRIIDWGMSQLHEDGHSVSTVLPGGTKWFASPEQLGSDTAAPSSLSDLYGVGALAYWLLTGTEPLRREIETDPETASGAMSGILQVRRLMEAGVRPERADRLAPDVPEQLGRLVDQWLSYTPADRTSLRPASSAALGWARDTLSDFHPETPGHERWYGSAPESSRWP